MKKLFMSLMLLLDMNVFAVDSSSKDIANKKFSVVVVHDGLGNQMFLYAFGRALEMQGINILYDKQWFADDKPHRGTKRILSLGKFDTKIKWASDKEINACLYRDQKVFANKYIMYILEKLRIVKQYCITDNNILQHDVREPFAYYDGYFQSDEYFKGIRDILLKDFALKISLNKENHSMLEKIRTINSICLHVRRGDYVSRPKINKLMGCCSIDYYIKAIKYIMSHLVDWHFFIFSDDIHWIKNTFVPSIQQSISNFTDYTIVDINNDDTNYFDLELMKNCKHNIIANSTFSWWGAWLNNNQSKIVIAPKRWFANDLPSNKADVTKSRYPDGWIQI